MPKTVSALFELIRPPKFKFDRIVKKLHGKPLEYGTYRFGVILPKNKDRRDYVLRKPLLLFLRLVSCLNANK